MNILFVGAGGSGMGALVHWHKELGNAAYLQDDSVSPAELRERYRGSQSFDQHVQIMFDRAVFTDAIPQGHPLRTYAERNNIPVRSYAEELGALSEGRDVIAIAGTHGKSTTTALISWALTVASRDPLCVIGAEIAEWHGGFRFGKGPVVLEADEFKKHFLHLRPSVVLVTSLEMDHFDTYADEDDLVRTFVNFCSQESVKFIVVARGTRALNRLSEELEKLGRSHVRFGNDDDLVYCARFDVVDGRSHAAVAINAKTCDFEFSSMACPHISNLLGAVSVLERVGVQGEVLKKGIDSFPGILRRLELLGKIEGIPLYSDYAHHPTKVRETLRMLRKIFPDHRIGVIFEPHERLRTSTLRDEYQTAFVYADAIGLLPVYDPIGRQRPDILQEATALSPSGNVTQLTDYADAFVWANNFAIKKSPIYSSVLENTGIDDEKKLIVIMGAGPIDGAFRRNIARGK